MVIIIEGLDRTGKTTLANELSKRFNIPIYKKDREEFGNSLEEDELINLGDSIATVKLFNSELFKGRHVILDRFHWSEYVFNIVDRGGFLNDRYLDEVCCEMDKNPSNYIIIHMHPTNLLRCVRNDEHGRDINTFAEYYKFFCEAQNHSESLHRDIKVYNSCYTGIDRTCDMIGDLIKMEE
jgi:thymidylate kinase